MNDIETGNQLKTHEIAGQMFDNEYDLAVAVIDGMTARSHQGGYTLERFKFNSRLTTQYPFEKKKEHKLNK